MEKKSICFLVGGGGCRPTAQKCCKVIWTFLHEPMNGPAIEETPQSHIIIRISQWIALRSVKSAGGAHSYIQ